MSVCRSACLSVCMCALTGDPVRHNVFTHTTGTNGAGGGGGGGLTEGGKLQEGAAGGPTVSNKIIGHSNRAGQTTHARRQNQSQLEKKKVWTFNSL